VCGVVCSYDAVLDDLETRFKVKPGNDTFPVKNYPPRDFGLGGGLRFLSALEFGFSLPYKVTIWGLNKSPAVQVWFGLSLTRSQTASDCVHLRRICVDSATP